MTPYAVATILRLVSDTIGNIERNVNARLALDVLMLRLPRINAPNHHPLLVTAENSVSKQR
jgi:hypothetical protein